MTAQCLAVTAPLSLALWVWVLVSRQRCALTGLAQNIAAVLPQLLWVRQKTTEIDHLDWDDSFWVVLRLIQEFHSMEEPASVALNRCKTSLAPIYGLQSVFTGSSLAPLLRSLFEDTNLALSRFVEDQTVHGRRHRRYCRTSSSSFPGPYTVPPRPVCPLSP